MENACRLKKEIEKAMPWRKEKERNEKQRHGIFHRRLNFDGTLSSIMQQAGLGVIIRELFESKSSAISLKYVKQKLLSKQDMYTKKIISTLGGSLIHV